MTTIHLKPQSEKLAPENPWGLEHQPLYHQLRTYQALQEYNLVVNTYNTGTGKTLASLLRLFDLDGQGKNVLFIAPTNALIQQHTADIQAFVERHDLDFRVLKVHAARLREMMEQGDRPGETLQRLIQNPLDYYDALDIPPDDHRKLPIVLVVNPDIFYYALYFRYGSHDQRNMFERILTAFDYIVIDEFHYYDSKQLANFLFFFVISRQFGYFDVRERRICLLSATPNEHVLEYLGRVFDKSDWTLIEPQDEPDEGADYASTPVLTSLELEIAEAEVQEWAGHHRGDLAAWLDAGQDGALISSALWRVNTCFTALRTTIDEEQMGRITGPEPEEKRRRATARSLILATPTVDIGYNFQKKEKPRQNIDFLICDARYGDELLQRLGRAGRVLGKSQHDGTSCAVALLDEAACRALADYDGETLSRAEFAEIVQGIEALPPKQTLYAYIRTHAITECFYPLYKLEHIMPDHLQEEMDALYERIQEVFAPGSKRPDWTLRKHFGKYWGRKQWLRDNKDGISLGRETAIQVADWIKWLKGPEHAYDPQSLVPYLDDYLEYERERQRLREFVEGQVHLAEALFNFRDSFQGATAVVYDKQHLLSSETINSYGLMHVVSNYRVQWLENRAEFARTYGEPEQEGDLYGAIRDWREPRLSLGLAYESPWPRDDFEDRVCRRPVALKGLRLEAKEWGGDRYPLDSRIAGVFAERYVTALGIAPDDGGVVYGKLGGTTIYPRRLTVIFPDGRREEGYRIILGTQAFQAHAELRGYFWMKDRLEGEAIII
jgi:CRISPR-associated endonuclease/helicase Cas3